MTFRTMQLVFPGTAGKPRASRPEDMHFWHLLMGSSQAVFSLIGAVVF